MRAVARIDLDAVRGNLARIRSLAGSADVMAVVKADAYGHGMLEISKVARDAGIAWLGVALPSEALALRAAGDTGRILAWLWTPGDPDLEACVRDAVDISVSSTGALAEVVAAAGRTSTQARVHVKVDTGLTRNGVHFDDLPALLAGCAMAIDEGTATLRTRNQCTVSALASRRPSNSLRLQECILLYDTSATVVLSSSIRTADTTSYAPESRCTV
jgi:alanine racemase